MNWDGIKTDVKTHNLFFIYVDWINPYNYNFNPTKIVSLFFDFIWRRMLSRSLVGMFQSLLYFLECCSVACWMSLVHSDLFLSIPSNFCGHVWKYQRQIPGSSARCVRVYGHRCIFVQKVHHSKVISVPVSIKKFWIWDEMKRSHRRQQMVTFFRTM